VDTFRQRPELQVGDGPFEIVFAVRSLVGDFSLLPVNLVLGR
jgi:hypothetical protein